MKSWKTYVNLTHLAGAENSGKSREHVSYILRPGELLFFDSNLAQDRGSLKVRFAELEKRDLQKRCDARFQYRVIMSLPNDLSVADTRKIINTLLAKSGLANTSWVYALHQGKNNQRDQNNLHVHVALNPRRIDNGKVEMALQKKSWLHDFKVLVEAELSPFVDIAPVEVGEGGLHLGWKLHALGRAAETGVDTSDLAIADGEKKVLIKLQKRCRAKKGETKTAQSANVIDLCEIKEKYRVRLNARQERQRTWEQRHQWAHQEEIAPQFPQSNRAAESTHSISSKTPFRLDIADPAALIRRIMARIVTLVSYTLPKVFSDLFSVIELAKDPASRGKIPAERPFWDPHTHADLLHKIAHQLTRGPRP